MKKKKSLKFEVTLFTQNLMMSILFVCLLLDLKDSSSSVPDRTALILFEDIDLFFGEADEGFYSAVNSLIATTKRPILLTTSKSSFLAMQDSAKSKVLKLLPQAFTFSPVEAEAAARHLQLMALVEGFIIDLNRLVENKAILFKGNTNLL